MFVNELRTDGIENQTKRKNANNVQNEVTKINPGKGAAPTAKLNHKGSHLESRIFSHKQIFSAQKHISYNHE
jgi:hypothetical protein